MATSAKRNLNKDRSVHLDWKNSRYFYLNDRANWLHYTEYMSKFVHVHKIYNFIAHDFFKRFGTHNIGKTPTNLPSFARNQRTEMALWDFEELTVPIPDWPEALEGLRIIHLSDFHLQPFTQLPLIQAAVAFTNTRQADLICLTGDFVLEPAEAIFELAPVLAQLRARYGRFAVLGNHDIWSNRTIVEEGLRQADIPLLINQNYTIEIGQAKLNIAGVDDAWSGQPDLEQALVGLDANYPTLLLCHEPDLADEYCQDSRVTMQLSGHSHGGQLRFPILGRLHHWFAINGHVAPPKSRAYTMGLFQVHGRWLYTNRGIGMVVFPIRLFCRPEITELTLVRQS